jgi:hypothetical protein
MRFSEVQKGKEWIGLASISRFCLLLVLLASGCASQPDISIEQRVGERALQWANALMSQDYDKALTFMTPSFQESPRADRFRGDFSGAGFWKDAKIKWVKCDEESGPELGSGATSTANSASGTSEPVDTMLADNEEECVVTSWESCGQTSALAATSPVTANNSSLVKSSARCDVRLILSVLKPPEMSFPMPIPYEAVWLKIGGAWYMYRQ